MKGKLNAIELFIFGFTSIGCIILLIISNDIFKIEQGAWYFQLWTVIKNLFLLLIGGFIVGVILSFFLGLPMRFFVNVMENKWKFNRNLWSSFIDDLKNVFPYSLITEGFYEMLIYPLMALALIVIVFILVIISFFYKIFLIDYGIQLSLGLDDSYVLVLLSVILPSMSLFILYKISNFLKINALKVILFLTGILIVMPNLYRLGTAKDVNENNIFQLSMLVKLCFGVILILMSTFISNDFKEKSAS
jgi:hypothetical protein